MKNLPIQVIYILIALIWWIAKNLHEYQMTGKFHIGFFVAWMFISMFTGYVFATFGGVIGVSEEVRTLFAALGGYMGTRTMEFVEEYFKMRYVKNPPQDSQIP